MLLIDRKAGTSVILKTKSGEEIKVTVVSQNNYGVKLGFDADKETVNILREEVYDRNRNKG